MTFAFSLYGLFSAGQSGAKRRSQVQCMLDDYLADSAIYGLERICQFRNHAVSNSSCCLKILKSFGPICGITLESSSLSYRTPSFSKQ